ncbi:MAG: ferrous iron transport protein A [Anaerolineae bacterium]|nr:ferrous iron transport protein A [Anaerolineae bacterium]
MITADSDSETTLDRLPAGAAAQVTALRMQGAERRRMMDLGILPGTILFAEMASPLGDPTAYLVRGALIALRREQARQIEIEPVSQEVSA